MRLRALTTAAALAGVLGMSGTAQAQSDTANPQSQQQAVATQAQGQQGAPAISRERAEQIALERRQGRVEEAEIESEDGRDVWEVEVEADDGQDYDVTIDASSGEVIEVDD